MAPHEGRLCPSRLIGTTPTLTLPLAHHRATGRLTSRHTTITTHTMANTTTTTPLTDLEQTLLDSITQGMDEPGCGWLHELNPFQNDHQAAGVLGSLISRGLVVSTHEEGDCYWLQLTTD